MTKRLITLTLTLLFLNVMFSCKDDETTINVDKVEITPGVINMTEGETKQLTAKATPAEAEDKTITWTSSDNTVATVDKNGLVTAVKKGNADVVASSVNGIHGKSKVTVTEKAVHVESIALVNTEGEVVTDLTMKIGDAEKLLVRVLPENATNTDVKCVISNTEVITIEGGFLKALKEGTSTITATSVDGNKTATCDVTVVGNITYGTFTDTRDNHEYKTIKIGEQTWLAENFAYLPDLYEPTFTSTMFPKYYVYGVDGGEIEDAKKTQNFKDYGVLYNYRAAVAICPDGWHLPSDEEWKALERESGMSAEDADKSGERGSIAYVLKDTKAWNEDECNNNSGMTVLPGGYLSAKAFASLSTETRFWTASITSDVNYITTRGFVKGDKILRGEMGKGDACYIRYVKNKE